MRLFLDGGGETTSPKCSGTFLFLEAGKENLH
jgi:hypothetical protein